MTKLTRQSAQSGVPLRIQSLQLIDSSIPLDIARLSLVPTLTGACDISAREERGNLLGDLGGAEHDALSDNGGPRRIDEHVERRPSNIEFA